MTEEIYCKDCLYYKEWNTRQITQHYSDHPHAEIQTDSQCKVHKERYSMDNQWHPVHSECFKTKE
jgi:hypothetical protein